MKIVLTGFMGAGKSATGKILARRLNLAFIDTDCIIEEKAGQSIKEIFQLQGEPFFRSLEKKLVAEVARKDGVVIAAGGGAILDPENRKNLKKNGIVIFLMVSPAEIRKRVAGDASRPLLNTPNNVGVPFPPRQRRVCLGHDMSPAGSTRLCQGYGGRVNRTPTKEKTIKNLLAQRLSLYRKADICVDTDGKTPREVAQDILERLKL